MLNKKMYNVYFVDKNINIPPIYRHIFDIKKCEKETLGRCSLIGKNLFLRIRENNYDETTYRNVSEAIQDLVSMCELTNICIVNIYTFMGIDGIDIISIREIFTQNSFSLVWQIVRT